MACEESETTVEFFNVSSEETLFSLRKYSSKDEVVLMFVIGFGPSIMCSFEAPTLDEIIEQLNKNVKISDKIIRFNTATFYIEVNDLLVDCPESFKKLFFNVFARLKFMQLEHKIFGIDLSDKNINEPLKDEHYKKGISLFSEPEKVKAIIDAWIPK